MQQATLISSKKISPKVKSLTFKIENWTPHQSGQYYKIRITKDGDILERDYSIASTPQKKGEVEFGIELLKDGEVSTKLWQLKKGDKINLYGPLGGNFVWDINTKNPLILIGGGSGVVPLVSIIRHHLDNLSDREIIYLSSFQTFEEILFLKDLVKAQKKDNNLKVFHTLTKSHPKNWPGFKKRIDLDILKEITLPLKQKTPIIFVSGSNFFVEDIIKLLIELGFKYSQIKSERFGG